MVMKRNTAIDGIRSAAAIAVVVFHVLGSSANNDPLVPAQVHTVITAITEAMRWHVPLFFIITGFLWLDREKECTYRKLLPNIRRFCLVLITIGYAYALMERFFVSRTLSVSLLLGGVGDVLRGDLWDHMWYMYAILGIYLLLPVLKPFFAQASSGALWGFTGVVFVFSVAAPILRDAVGYTIPIDFPATTGLVYLCVGGLLSREKPHSRRGGILSGAVFCASCVLVYAAMTAVPGLRAWVPLFTFAGAVGLFVCLYVFVSPVAESGVLGAFSRCTFGIYLLHPFFINGMIKLLHIYPLRGPAVPALAAACLAVIGLSFALTYFLRKIRWIRRYLL